MCSESWIKIQTLENSRGHGSSVAFLENISLYDLCRAVSWGCTLTKLLCFILASFFCNEIGIPHF